MGYFYAILNNDDVVINVYELPMPVTDNYYISIDSLDNTLIGKRYNRNTGLFEEVDVYYYAFLDGNDFVTAVVTMYEEVTHVSYILLNQYDDSIVGYWYDRVNEVFLSPAEYNLMLMKTVDGSSSGLDADLLDGQHAAAFASSTHNHDTSYADIDHDHDTEYAAIGHTHSDTGQSMTADDILDELLTVDGANSELDADLLDGQHASYFATSGHTHNNYAASDHTHSNYAASDHTHSNYATTTQLSGKADSDHTHSGYSLTNHTHTTYATTTQLNGKADVSHEHSNYATTTQLSAKADSNHTHSGYATTTQLNGKANTNHTHSQYATTSDLDDKADSSHTHNDYFSVNGGTIGGEVNINGIVRVNSQQMIYYSTGTSSQTIGTNNATGGTTIACGPNANAAINGANLLTPNVLPRGNFTLGNSNSRWTGIYSKAAVNVSSDERLKDNIVDVNEDKCSEFIEGIKVKNFNFKNDSKKEIGVIAQDLININPMFANYFVNIGEDGYYGVKTSDLIFPLIVTVQKLQKEIEELKK